jgi:hypothetical protein
MLKEDWEAAHCYYLEAVQLHSRESSDFYNLVLSVTMAGKVAEFGIEAVFEWIEKGISLDPSNDSLYQARATMYEALGEAGKAADDRSTARAILDARIKGAALLPADVATERAKGNLRRDM